MAEMIDMPAAAIVLGGTLVATLLRGNPVSSMCLLPQPGATRTAALAAGAWDASVRVWDVAACCDVAGPIAARCCA